MAYLLPRRPDADMLRKDPPSTDRKETLLEEPYDPPMADRKEEL